jgi:hypothetical protein
VRGEKLKLERRADKVTSYFGAYRHSLFVQIAARWKREDVSTFNRGLILHAASCWARPIKLRAVMQFEIPENGTIRHPFGCLLPGSRAIASALDWLNGSKL